MHKFGNNEGRIQATTVSHESVVTDFHDFFESPNLAGEEIQYNQVTFPGNSKCIVNSWFNISKWIFLRRVGEMIPPLTCTAPEKS